jgi:hypothetical protein
MPLPTKVAALASGCPPRYSSNVHGLSSRTASAVVHGYLFTRTRMSSLVIDGFSCQILCGDPGPRLGCHWG